MVNKGIVLGQLERLDEEVAVYDEVVKLFGVSGEIELKSPVAKALLNKGINIGKRGNLDEEIVIYNEVIRRFGNAKDLELKELVANSLINKGINLSRQNKINEAKVVFDEIDQRFGDAKEPELKIKVATALVSKSIILAEEGEIEKELNAYDEVLKRFGDAEEPKLQEQVARALVNKGSIISKQGKWKEGNRIYDEVVTRFKISMEPALMKQVAMALVNKGIILSEQGKPQEAVKSFDGVLNSLRDTQEPELQEQVARALLNKGITLSREGKLQEGNAIYNDVVKRFSNAAEPEIKEQVAISLVNIGSNLIMLDKLEEAESVYNDVLKRFGSAGEPMLKEQFIKALISKGLILCKQGKLEEGIEIYDDVDKRFGDARESGIWELVAWALGNKGVALSRQGKLEKANKIYSHIIDRIGRTEESEAKDLVAWALVNKGFNLSRLEKLEDAITTYEQVITRFENAKEPEIKELVAKALLSKGITLIKLGKHEAAKKALESANRIEHSNETIKQMLSFILGASSEESSIINLINEIIETFSHDKREHFFEEIRDRKRHNKDFLEIESKFQTKKNEAIFLCLRECNSYTPAVPDRREINRGGGYYIRYKSQGIVIDPGYDFIKNFGAADGRICDIDHIIITHAHNDHTQDFESLLSIIYQFNKKHKKNIKRVNLYLSQGAMRKFSGYLPLRNVDYIDRIEILNQGCRENPQIVPLHKLNGAKLTVLRAFHDDTITLDYSVGIGLDFEINNSMHRTVVFTGDTGLFPPKKDEAGQVLKKDNGEPILDIHATKAIYNEYPNQFQRPNLLIPHIGSIKEDEFKTDHLAKPTIREQEETLYFYPNHLGLRGLILLLDNLKPDVAIISEFGEELRTIRFELARGITELFKKRRKKEEPHIFVVPGDLTLIYDIKQNKFFCHDMQKYYSPTEIDFSEVDEPENSRFYCTGIRRTYIFKKPTPNKTSAINKVCHFHLDVKTYGQPYCRKSGEHSGE